MSEPLVGPVRKYKEPSGQRWTFGIEWERVRGRYEPVQIQVRSKPAPISASALRRLPLGEIIARARRDLGELELSLPLPILAPYVGLECPSRSDWHSSECLQAIPIIGHNLKNQ